MITTVLGDIPSADLGVTDCHDHLFIRAGATTEHEPGFLLDDEEAAAAEVRTLAAAGASALVDCMPLGTGRDADALVRVAQTTGLHILAVSGFHTEAYYPEGHWVRALDVDALVAVVASEVTVGLGRDPYAAPDAHRSVARAGAIKIATSGDEPTSLERKLVTAAGSAAAATGAAVITHTESVRAAHWQLEALAAVGVPPRRVVLSHMDRHGTPEEVADVCTAGATVCLDWVGRLDRRPDEVVSDLAARLVAAGHGERVVLGSDMARRSYWQAYGGGPGLAHLFVAVVPLLASAGVDETAIAQILTRTPSRVFARAEPGGSGT